MANTFRHKRSAVQGKAPVVGDLALGELALNTYDGKVYMKKNDGFDSIVEIGSDAATLDGIDSGSFLRSDVADTVTAKTTWDIARTDAIGLNKPTTTSYTGITFSEVDDARFLFYVNNQPDGNLTLQARKNGTNIKTVFSVDNTTGSMNFGVSPTILNNTVWTAGNDGAGSGLDADLLDGLDSTQFLRSDAIDTKTAGSLTFDDNVHLRIGTDDDTRIYHNGSSTFVEHVGTGNLVLRNLTDDADVVVQTDNGSGSHTAYFRADGSTGEIVLYHYGFQKFATKSTGIQVTGSGTFTDNLTVEGAGGAGTPFRFGSGDRGGQINTYQVGSVANGGIELEAVHSVGSEVSFKTQGTRRITIDRSGNLLIGGTLPDSPNTRLNASGSATFSDTVTSERSTDGYAFKSEYDGVERGGFYASSTGSSFDLKDSNGDITLKLSSSGSIGVGTASPGNSLEVVGDLETGGQGHGTINITSDINTNNGQDARPSIGFSAPHSSLNTRILYATIEGRKETAGQGNTQGFLAFSTSPTGTTGPVERMRIDSDGNAGIGTSSPGSRLEVSRLGSAWTGVAPGTGSAVFLHNGNNLTSSPAALQISGGSASSSVIYFGDENDADVGHISYGHGSDSMTFRVNTSERMRINSGGDVGIGTSSPSYKLDVVGESLGTIANNTTDLLRLAATTANFDQLTFQTKRLADGADWTSVAHRIQRRVDSTLMGYIQLGGRDDDLITFGESNTERMRIDGDGKVGIGTSDPGAQLEVAATNGAGDPRIKLGSANDHPFVELNRWTGVDANYYGVRTRSVLGDYTIETADLTTLGAHTYTEQMRIERGGNVGIGTSTPEKKLHIYESTTANAEIRVQGGGESDSMQLFHGTANYGIYSDSSTKPFTISTNATERMRITSDGQLRLAGSGIQFNGDTAAANSLDDYEEGTWTPVITAETGSFAALDLENISSLYTKIGNVVTVQCFIRTDDYDETGASGNLIVTGLPYAAKTGATRSIGSPLLMEYNTEASFVGTFAPMLASSTEIQFVRVDEGGTGTASDRLQVTQLQSTTNDNRNWMTFSMTYVAS